MSVQTMDERDEAIVAARVAALDEVRGVRVGDWVRFADGIERRVAHVWDWEDGDVPLIQTSAGGSFYLGDGYVSMSGSLYPSVPETTFTLTDERRDGSVWIFHHDWHRAHNGVDLTIPFRVYSCSVAAPK